MYDKIIIDRMEEGGGECEAWRRADVLHRVLA